MLRNIIFDMGKVLFDFDPRRTLRRTGCSEADQLLLRRALFDAPQWLEGDRGVIPTAGMFEAVKDAVPQRLWPALRFCIDHWADAQDLYPLSGAADCVLALKERGYSLYVLSNASDLFFDYFPRLMPLDTWDGIMVSYQEKLLKPDPAIYLRLLERWGLRAEECLFIDDRAENTAAAEALGIHTVTFTGDYEAVLDAVERL